jgi:hypothetical protein
MRPLLLAALLLALPYLAQEAKGAKKDSLGLSGLRMPSLGSVPKAEGLQAPKAAPLPEGTRQSGGPAQYKVVEVVHAAGFVAGEKGPQPMGEPLTQVSLKGKPPTTERFSTLLRVDSTSPSGAPIEVLVLDGRGETVMQSSGRLSFGGTTSSHFQVDWTPSGLRRGGTYQVLVRVAGEPLGTWPLEVRQQ